MNPRSKVIKKMENINIRIVYVLSIFCKKFGYSCRKVVDIYGLDLLGIW